jgi:hypothetical protein
LTERWCQAVRELYELQQSSANEKPHPAKQTLTPAREAVTATATTSKYPEYGVWEDELPDSFDKNRTPAKIVVEEDMLPTPRTTSYIMDAMVADLAEPGMRGEFMLTTGKEYFSEYDQAMLDAIKASASLPVSPSLENFAGSNIMFDEAHGVVFDLDEAIPDLESIISNLGTDPTSALNQAELTRLTAVL